MAKHYAEIIGTPVSLDLLGELNSRLTSCCVEKLTVQQYGDIEEHFSIHMEGIVKGFNWTFFSFGIEGNAHSTRGSKPTINKELFRCVETQKDRDELEKFFVESVVPMYC